MSRGCALWIVLFAAGLFSVVPFALAPTPDQAWTQAYVEENWRYVESRTIYPDIATNRSFEVGWDSTYRYHVNRATPGYGSTSLTGAGSAPARLIG